MLMIWMATFGMEGVLHILPAAWQFRRALSIIIVLLVVVSTLLLMKSVGLDTRLLLGFLGMYRLGNLARIIKNRMHPDYLKRAAGRTSFWLFLLHPLFLGILAFTLFLTAMYSLTLLIVAQLVVAAAILMITYRNIHKLRFRMPETFLSDEELPTVTVAVPARNETADLEECLRSILANDYPKLEVLVLDDCSQDRTADIIRHFAHDGVRFVQGEQPYERWLAKNQAYQKLYQEANGDLVLFCGVDVRFGEHTIRSMVNLLYARNKSMLSVLPTRAETSPASAFIQPMRYRWELAYPRRLFNRPPVLSTCWMIGRSDIKKFGGFAAVSHAVLPEAFFAGEMVKTDQYSFVRSSNQLEVKTTKSFQEQYATAVRTKYPQLRRRPELLLLLTAAYVAFLLLPFVFVVASMAGAGINIWLPALTCLLLTATHVLIVAATDPANIFLACFTFPAAVLGELIINYVSMVKYEFLTVDWKDRNICIPVMHIVSHLPWVKES